MNKSFNVGELQFISNGEGGYMHRLHLLTILVERTIVGTWEAGIYETDKDGHIITSKPIASILKPSREDAVLYLLDRLRAIQFLLEHHSHIWSSCDDILGGKQ